MKKCAIFVFIGPHGPKNRSDGIINTLSRFLDIKLTLHEYPMRFQYFDFEIFQKVVRGGKKKHLSLNSISEVRWSTDIDLKL